MLREVDCERMAGSPARLRSAASKLTGGKNLRPPRIIGNRRNEVIEKLVEPGGSFEVDGLCQIILRTVIAGLVPLAVAPFGVCPRVIPEDETDGGHSFQEKGILVRAMQQIAL